MSVVKHYEKRIKCGLSWREEYVMGVLEEGEVKTAYITAMLASPVYVKDVLDNLVRKGFVYKKPYDKRTNVYGLTGMGVIYLKEVNEIYAKR